jgi:Ca2+-binding RTX toxin-like protein
LGSDTIIASRGNDTINGGGNDDKITGGFGSDSIVGLFGGNDTFVYTDVDESPAGAGDTVAGVDGIGTPGGDVFDLRQIDTTLTSVNEAFNFIGEAAFSAPFQLRVSNTGFNTLIEGDVDGDRAADLQILVQDGTVVAADYTAGDFIL